MKTSRSGLTLAGALMVLSVAAATSATPPGAVAPAGSMAQPTFLNAGDLSWHDAPRSLPKGAEMTVLHGDPEKAGPFVVRFRTSGAYQIPPHFHSRAETLTVLTGRLYLGSGERFDAAKAHALEVGAFHYLPAKSPHFVFSKGPMVVELHGEGPFDIVYLNPDDDPRKGSRRE
jgi:hypothetical protein